MVINKSEIKTIGYLLFLGLIGFLIHFLLLRAFPEKLYAPGILYVHPFLFIITVVIIIAIDVIFKKVKPNMMGYAFMASSLFKMLIAVLYLLPVITKQVPYKTEYVIQFFMIYFMYLIIEVVYLVHKLKKN